MEKHEKKLAVDMLQMLAEILSNRGCNDWDFPVDWTLSQRAKFAKEYLEFIEDVTDYRAGNTRLGDNEAVMLLAHKLRLSV